MFNRRRITAALIGLLVLVLGGWLVQNAVSPDSPGDSSGKPAASSTSTAGHGSQAGSVAGADSKLPVKALSSLPEAAAETWKLIEAGGPYPYPRNDDVVFGNREKLLPRKGNGYYHEYTVKTPGSRDRGARRLISGDAHELYYTGDHYTSFVVVDTTR